MHDVSLSRSEICVTLSFTPLLSVSIPFTKTEGGTRGPYHHPHLSSFQPQLFTPFNSTATDCYIPDNASVSLFGRARPLVPDQGDLRPHMFKPYIEEAQKG